MKIKSILSHLLPILIMGCNEGNLTGTGQQKPSGASPRINPPPQKAELTVQQELSTSFKIQAYFAKIADLQKNYQSPAGFSYRNKQGDDKLAVTYFDKSNVAQAVTGIPLPDTTQTITAATLSPQKTLTVGLSNGDIYRYPPGPSGWKQAPQKIVDGKDICVYSADGKFKDLTKCNLAITALSTASNADGSKDIQYTAIGTGVQVLKRTDDFFNQPLDTSVAIPGINSSGLRLGLTFAWTVYTQSVGGQIYYLDEGKNSPGLYWNNSGNPGQAVSNVQAVSIDPVSADFNPYIFVWYAPNQHVSDTTSSAFKITIPLAAGGGGLGSFLPGVEFASNHPGFTALTYDYGIAPMGRPGGVSRLSDYLDTSQVSIVMPDLLKNRMYIGTTKGDVYMWLWPSTLSQAKRNATLANWSLLDHGVYAAKPTAFALAGSDLLVGYSNSAPGVNKWYIKRYFAGRDWSPSSVVQPYNSVIYVCQSQYCGDISTMDYSNESHNFVAVGMRVRNPQEPSAATSGTIQWNEHYIQGSDFDPGDWQEIAKLNPVDHLKTLVSSGGKWYLAYSSSFLNYANGSAGGVPEMNAYAYQITPGSKQAQLLPGQVDINNFLNNYRIPIGSASCDPLNDGNFAIVANPKFYYFKSGVQEITAINLKEEDDNKIYLYANSSPMLVSDLETGTFLFAVTPATIRQNIFNSADRNFVSTLPMFSGKWRCVETFGMSTPDMPNDYQDQDSMDCGN